MANPTIRIHNIETNEVIDREMTDTEFAKYEADRLAENEKAELRAAKAAEKEALLERLGITQEEAKLLLS
jgi:hypothetical protein